MNKKCIYEEKRGKQNYIVPEILDQNDPENAKTPVHDHHFEKKLLLLPFLEHASLQHLTETLKNNKTKRKK